MLTLLCLGLCVFCNWTKLLSLTLHAFFCSPSLSGWFTMLSRVQNATPEQLLEMSHEQANPKNAVVSVLTLRALSPLNLLSVLTTGFALFLSGHTGCWID